MKHAATARTTRTKTASATLRVLLAATLALSGLAGAAPAWADEPAEEGGHPPLTAQSAGTADDEPEAAAAEAEAPAAESAAPAAMPAPAAPAADEEAIYAEGEVIVVLAGDAPEAVEAAAVEESVAGLSGQGAEAVEVEVISEASGADGGGPGLDGGDAPASASGADGSTSASDGSAGGSTLLVGLPADVPVEDALLRLAGEEGVAFAQPNYLYALVDGVPDDDAVLGADSSSSAASGDAADGGIPTPDSPSATATDDPYLDGFAGDWWLRAVRAFDAWDLKKAEGSVAVAVVDTGIRLDHVDLKDNILSDLAWDAVEGRPLDASTGNGGDLSGHGTHVAGIAAARANNGLLTAGVSYNAKVLPVNVFHRNDNDTIGARTSDEIKAFDYVMACNEEHGANVRVVNLSLGGRTYDTLLQAKIAEAKAAGILTVASAGNDAEKPENIDGGGSSVPQYPSDYPEVTAVTSVRQVDRNDQQLELGYVPSAFSEHNDAKDIAAPGEYISSTYDTAPNATASMNGTSMAAPVVSGTAALLFARNPTLTPEDVQQALYDNAVDLGDEGKDNYYGHGLVDAYAALASVEEVIVHTLTLKDDDETVLGTQRVVSGTAPEAPPLPSREGHTFLGWFTEPGSGTEVDATAPLTADATWYARWEADAVPAQIVLQAQEAGDLTVTNQWTGPVVVSRDGEQDITLQGGSSATLTVGIGEQVVVKESNAGVTFRSWTPRYWYSSSDPLASGAPCAVASMPAMPAFTTDDTGTKAGDYFFSHFNSQGSLASLPEGSFDTSGITEAGDGFFSNFDSHPTPHSYPVSSLKSLPQSFKLPQALSSVGTDYCASMFESSSLVAGDRTVPLYFAVAATDAFTGTGISPASPEAGATVYVNGDPGWSPPPLCTVTFDPAGGALAAGDASRKLAAGSALGALPVPTRPGHAFQGWFTAASGGTQVGAATTVTAPVTFFARWKADTCTVAFDAAGGSVSPLSVKVLYGAAIGTLPTPTRTGHVFAGWYTAPVGGARAVGGAAVTADATWYARWTANVCTVTFKGWDGTLLGTPQKVAYGTGAVAPDAPKRAGHTFVRWDREFASVTSNLVVTALYRANTCTVKFDANGGKVAGKASTSVTRDYGQALGALATPARTGHDFQGWYTARSGGQKVASGTKVAGNVTYWAHWKAKACTIKLNANGGKVGKASASSVKRPYGSKLGKLAIPVRTGYTLLGWYTAKSGGQKVTAATKVTKSVTLYAHWKAKTYTVKLNANGGKVGKAPISSLKKSHNAKLGKLATPKRAGHQFLGWYTKKSGGQKVTAATRVTKAVTLYAHWKRVR